MSTQSSTYKPTVATSVAQQSMAAAWALMQGSVESLEKYKAKSGAHLISSKGQQD